ncbi:hypothetical protein L6164_015997 [Bauhinia variegata]|uniref:Uncharacterized protein n=1 Tax=Bauhinia variegata TaxID=167791 RepID=A0ACB9NM99_BAUVA|nr:hypothetical protein L6164_015997 [Bauhinia variegata]
MMWRNNLSSDFETNNIFLSLSPIPNPNPINPATPQLHFSASEEMEHNPNRAEAERLLGIAEKLLQNRDLHGSKDFAILAQETEPLLEGSDQILAVVEVLLAAERRVNNHHDWYAILQVDRRSDDHDFIKKQYRRLALLLHPDKNRFFLADLAFKLVGEAWAVLSDQTKKSLYDRELNLFSRVDLSLPAHGSSQHEKLPVVRRVSRPSGRNTARDHEVEEDPRRRTTFWTPCPYCYLLYEYPKVYENCCLRCQNCERSFHGISIQSLPPLVPGQEAYYCCWGFFPMGFVFGNSSGKGTTPPAGFPSWVPPVFHENQRAENARENEEPPPPPPQPPVSVPVPNGVATGLRSGPTPRKRGRPRKNPLPS